MNDVTYFKSCVTLSEINEQTFNRENSLTVNP